MADELMIIKFMCHAYCPILIISSILTVISPITSVRNPYEIRIFDCNPSRDWINPIPNPRSPPSGNPHSIFPLQLDYKYSNSQPYSHEPCTCIPKSVRYGMWNFGKQILEQKVTISARMHHKILKTSLNHWVTGFCIPLYSGNSL